MAKDLSNAKQWIKLAPERRSCPTDLYFPPLAVLFIWYGSVSETHSSKTAARNFIWQMESVFSLEMTQYTKGTEGYAVFQTNFFTCTANSSRANSWYATRANWCRNTLQDSPSLPWQGPKVKVEPGPQWSWQQHHPPAPGDFQLQQSAQFLLIHWLQSDTTTICLGSCLGYTVRCCFNASWDSTICQVSLSPPINIHSLPNSMS